MIQNTNKNGMIKHGDLVFGSVENFTKKIKITNKNLESAFAGFMFNYSVLVNQKKVDDQKSLDIFIRILKLRLASDTNEDNRSLLLQAGANVLFKNQNRRADFQFLGEYLQGGDSSKDIEMLLS